MTELLFAPTFTFLYFIYLIRTMHINQHINRKHQYKYELECVPELAQLLHFIRDVTIIVYVGWLGLHKQRLYVCC